MGGTPPSCAMRWSGYRFLSRCEALAGTKNLATKIGQKGHFRPTVFGARWPREKSGLEKGTRGQSRRDNELGGEGGYHMPPDPKA